MISRVLPLFLWNNPRGVVSLILSVRKWLFIECIKLSCWYQKLNWQKMILLQTNSNLICIGKHCIARPPSNFSWGGGVELFWNLPSWGVEKISKKLGEGKTKLGRVEFYLGGRAHIIMINEILIHINTCKWKFESLFEFIIFSIVKSYTIY